MTQPVSREQRFTKTHPCPICSGWKEKPRHIGERCAGYLSEGGDVAFCTREEHAGTLELQTHLNPPAYAHALNGCTCGVAHAENRNGLPAQTVNVNKRSKKRSSVEEYRWEYKGADSKTYVKHKVGRGENSETWWDPAPLAGMELDLYETTPLEDVPEGKTIDLTDGEHDADEIHEDGGYAVTSGSLAQLTEAHAERLASRHVRVHADRDGGEGVRQARRAMRLLQRYSCEVEVVEAWEGKDAADHLSRGNSLNNFYPVWYMPIPRLREEPKEPEMREEAFYGPAGEYVHLIDGHTEADPRAILVQLLVAFGNTVSRNPHHAVGNDRHGANENVLVVGDSASARKGTGVREVEAFLADAIPSYNADRERPNVMYGGLVSGEGLVARVANRTEVSAETSDGTTKVHVEEKHDGRVLVIEDEFGAILSVLLRQGVTLSTMLRKGWDGRPIENNSISNPYEARDHHISVIAHVTQFELRERLQNIDMANGFANRFLFCFSKREKYLPEPGRPKEGEYKALVATFASAHAFARKQREMKMDKAARKYWNERMYPELETQQYMGVLDALTARRSAHVLRLALIYALLDESREIRVAHLDAARAVSDYSEATCTFIFSDLTGNKDADKILEAVRDHVDGMSRRDIHNLFSGNRKVEQIDFALDLLLRNHLIEEVSNVQKKGPGRRATRYYAL